MTAADRADDARGRTDNSQAEAVSTDIDNAVDTNAALLTGFGKTCRAK